ncbi:TIGR00730 family Rossman fold protein [Streptomyces sp. 150FB]|uniref:LOG family protein n=1 Tax=Streptomyces sp. 150FB TaxID=1576605 RepID=UPI000697FBC6|nr:TIGR00730 family Rossman fold protein [Streptomyces sp. 150FB]
MKICVFLSATNTEEFYAAPVRELARLIVEGGHSLVWGGSEAGLMKVLADTVQDAGGSLIGVSVESLRWILRDKLREGDEMNVTEDLAARKALLLERSDAFIIMPGGTGTLDEWTDVLELRRHRTHDKPIVVVNFDGFYDGLHLLLGRMERSGFLDHPSSTVVEFAPDPATAMGIVEAARGTAPDGQGDKQGALG